MLLCRFTVSTLLGTKEVLFARNLSCAFRTGDRNGARSDLLREMRLLLLEEGHCFREPGVVVFAKCIISPSA